MNRLRIVDKDELVGAVVVAVNQRADEVECIKDGRTLIYQAPVDKEPAGRVLEDFDGE